MSNASLVFLPWVRQGAAAAISTLETLAVGQGAVATVTPTLALNEKSVSGVSVTLRGPADVIGIDANQVVRTDPRPGTSDFEPNYFPSIEFDRPDLPWLFTPLKANGKGQLRPWLCLVVLRKQEGITLASTPDRPVSTVHIAAPAMPALELPKLTDSWAWAHAQVAADASTAQLTTLDANTHQLIAGTLNGPPDASLSRLVCPRFLAPNTEYIACVVPTFDATRRAALGLPPVSTLAPAWTATSTDVLLPVYYHWEFRTGQAGDFESLVRRLRPTAADGLGTRTIDVSQAGFPPGGATTVEMEGALAPIPAAGDPTPADPIPSGFKDVLATIVNGGLQESTVDPGIDPRLAPPAYGRWHAAKSVVSPTQATWLEQLNLDPRWRMAAAFGTRVVQQHQEALMASAWEQAADLSIANQRLRQLQLSMAVGEGIHRRHFATLSEEALLRVAAPAFGRLSDTTGPAGLLPTQPGSLLSRQAATVLPLAANRSAMRRIGRERGPLTRRIAGQGGARTETWVAVLNQMVPEVAPPPPPPPAYAAMPPLTTVVQRTADNQSYFGAFLVAPERGPLGAPGAAVLRSTPTEVPDFFRSAAREHLDRFFPSRTVQAPPARLAFENVKPVVLAQTDPRVTLPALANSAFTTGDRILAPTALSIAPTGVETVMAAPHFPHPMYEPLRELSQDLLLPGLDKVQPDSVMGLRTNLRFVEAYMVGLNHEMGRELLWRGYPTDQRGTYFDRFWGLGEGGAPPPDITDLHTWGTRSLGSDVGAPARADQFVLLLRSSLLRRYPNAVVYLTPAVSSGTPTATLVPDVTPANEQVPVFSGSMEPDVSFFGFAVTAAAAVGGGSNGLGYYVVIQEHPTEPRFGIDVGVPVGSATHAVIGSIPATGLTWGANAAEMAGSARSLPMRIAIHASRLINPA